MGLWYLLEMNEWNQIHETGGYHGYRVFDAISFAPFQTLL
jgi:hypothetical protein